MIFTFKPRTTGETFDHDILSFTGARLEPVLPNMDPRGARTMRLPNGERISVYTDEIVEHDREFDIEAFIDGYTVAALWADCQPDWFIEERDGAFVVLNAFNDVEASFATIDIAEADVKDRRENSEFGGLEGLELTDAAREHMAEACRSFFTFNAADLLAYVAECENGGRIGYDGSDGPPEAWAGHDFWLTRRGHGAGFWDRGLGDLGKRLSEAANACGDTGYPYAIGDGKADVERW